MKRLLGWVVVVSLVSGGGLVLNKAFKRFKSNAPMAADSAANAEHDDGAMKEENQAASKAAAESEDAGTQRVTKIGELVDSSILADSQSIDTLSSRISDLQKTIAGLANTRRSHEMRVGRLQRIKEVLESKKVAYDDRRGESRASVVVQSDDLARWSKEEDALQKANLHFKKTVAQIARGVNESTLTVDGQSLLILDDKPVRVSRENAGALGPVISSFKENKQLENVVIRATTKMPLASVRVINEYLNRVYNVSALFVQVPEGDGSRYPIEIEFQGKTPSKTPATAETKRDGAANSGKKIPKVARNN